MNDEHTSAKILNAARDIVERDGAAAVSMRRVADAVGITPRAIYRHFKNRDALLKSVGDAAFPRSRVKVVRTDPESGPGVRITTLHGGLSRLCIAAP